jgi:hypothetical protein
LLTGLVEGIGLWVLQNANLLQGQIRFLGAKPQIIWISAFFDLILFFSIAGLIFGPYHVFPRLHSDKFLILLFVFLLTYDWLIIVLAGRISMFATPILAAGVSYQVLQIIYERRVEMSKICYMAFCDRGRLICVDPRCCGN